MVNRKCIKLIALLMMSSLVWLGGVNPVAATPPPPNPAISDQIPCLACHETIRSHWLNSGHATAVTNTSFQIEWQAQGVPASCLDCHAAGSGARGGVSCTACHNPAPAAHPDAVMPTTVSSRMCADCHMDTYADWQDAYHSRADFRCVHCHDPHAAGLKPDAVQSLCGTCHESTDHTAVAEFDEATLCTDCHLVLTTHQAENGRRWQDHTLVLNIDSCRDCPAGQIFDNEGGLMARTAVTTNNSYLVTPGSFALVAALLSLGVMVVLAPWLSRWLRGTP